MKIADALDECAKKASLSNVQIAAQVGVSESCVARWRNGEREPRAGHYVKLMKVFPELTDLVAV